jgi:hypothetical protein
MLTPLLLVQMKKPPQRRGCRIREPEAGGKKISRPGRAETTTMTVLTTIGIIGIMESNRSAVTSTGASAENTLSIYGGGIFCETIQDCQGTNRDTEISQ